MTTVRSQKLANRAHGVRKLFKPRWGKTKEVMPTLPVGNRWLRGMVRTA